MKMAVFICHHHDGGSTSETSVNFCRNTRRNNPEDSHLLPLCDVPCISTVSNNLGPEGF
jgi:hypothetical protein